MPALARNERICTPRLAGRALIVAITLLFTVSPMSLSLLGVEYDSADSPFWQKLHPSTFVALLAFAVDLLLRRHPLRWIASLPERFPGAAYFLCMWALLLAHGLLNQRTQVTTLFEPYALAIIALSMIEDMRAPQRNALRTILHVAICLNATIGVFEYVTQERLFPYVIGGAPVIGDRRATALLGHPLLNASTTGAYILCLALGGDAKLTAIWRSIALLVTALGMIAFGGRTAIAVSSIFLAAIALRKGASLLSGARFPAAGALAAFVIAPALSAVFVGAAQAGVFDAFLSRYVDDNGSGEARLIALQLFDRFELGEILLGPRSDVVDSALASLGIEIGIENNWLALLFHYGAWMTVFFCMGLFALLFEYWRLCRSGATILFVYFLAIISSAIGLAAKTVIFAQFAVVLLVLFSREGDDKETAPSIRRFPVEAETTP